MTLLTQKQILFIEELIVIQYDVTGEVMVSQIKNGNRNKKFRKLLPTLLGLNQGLIEIEKPIHIPNGLRVNINIHMNDNMNNELKNIEKLLLKSIKNGQLADTMMESWDLDQIPMISNLKCFAKDSKQKARAKTQNKVKQTIELQNETGNE